MSETTARPIRSKALLAELQKLVKRLLEDLRERSEEQSAVREQLTGQHQAALDAGATAESYTAWREAQLTQVAVSWVLASVFVRYLEDNGFLDQPLLAGHGDARRRVADRISAYFRTNPTHTDREYLQDVFRSISLLPGCQELLGEDRNPLWRVGLSGDGARAVLEFWQAIDPASGDLLRPLESPEGDTRFLGDLYQDLNEEARSRFALLQTPEFVEEFILDRVLEPAVQEFGLEKTTLIDPTCGSGHFLLGGFARLLGKWTKAEPGTNVRELARRALEQVHGVDVNPFAVAIARFRLLLAFLRACDIRRLVDCPDVHPRVATGDSLLHGRMVDAKGQPLLEAWPPDVVAEGDYEDAVRMLKGSYAAVVGNPPYIIDRDRAHNAAVRSHYSSAYQKFSLGVPFTERFFDLAHSSRSGRAGFVGMITANSFMKREFGKKLIEDYLPSVDLTHVMDTSGAYIPGHGTPTVILIGRNRVPGGSDVRAVMGIRGEPSTPDNPSAGKVWSSIVELVDRNGGLNQFVSVSDVSRATFSKHPWSIGGGGAAELKEEIEDRCSIRLSDLCKEIGWTTVLGEDDVWLFQEHSGATRANVEAFVKPMVVGDRVRDWAIANTPAAVYPYSSLGGAALENSSSLVTRYLWPYRTNLKSRTMFHQSLEDRGLPYYEHMQHSIAKLRTPLSIAFAFVATHNHFVLDRGGKVFNRTAPIIKLPPEATEDDHLALLGLLNSSVACFWFKATGQNRGSTVDQAGARQRTIPFEDFWEISGTQAGKFPVADAQKKTLIYSKALDKLATERNQVSPGSLAASNKLDGSELRAAEQKDNALFEQSIALQEELDWQCYGLYGLITETPLQVIEDLPPIRLGERAFEIALARKMRDEGIESTWFTRHGSAPIAEIPGHWPDGYRQVVEQRLELLAENSLLQLVEQPEYKRRWNREEWEQSASNATRAWLLDRLESPAYWSERTLTTSARLADRARRDSGFVEVARLHAGAQDPDIARIVNDLVVSDSLPFLPAFRYKPSGLAKRAEWENTWALQRREDAGEKVGVIPIPPKYASADFAQPHFWRLRGKLDVPKERFISYPRLERETDPSPVIGWAGWDALEQAQALASYYLERKEQDGWTPERLMPLLAGLTELLPWLKQWHNEVHPEFGERMGDYYQSFTEQEARALGTTLDAIKSWTPPASSGSTRGRKKK